MPVPRLGPGPCSALGAHNPTSICDQGCWDTHQRVTTLKKLSRKLTWECYSRSPALHKTRFLCQGCTNSKDSTHPKASLTDRNDRQGTERSHCRTRKSSELALASRLWISPLPTAYLLEHTTI